MCTADITQTAGFGSYDNQFVGEQTNNYYNGMTPQQALDLTMNLFWKNFPKLQAVAEDIARQRVEQFCQETIKKLERDRRADYSALADPGAQYILVDAQKSYVRYGTEEMLNILTELVYSRVKNNDDFILKVTIDKAISVASMLTSTCLDYLSLLFMCTMVKDPLIKTLQDLVDHMNFLCSTFPVSIYDVPVSYLNILGCMQLNLPNPVDNFAKTYGFKKDLVEAICPQQIKSLESDYGLSYVGIILAIINAEQKMSIKFDPHIWIY